MAGKEDEDTEAANTPAPAGERGEKENHDDNGTRKTREAGRETGPVGKNNAGDERRGHAPWKVIRAGWVPGRSGVTPPPS